ncbi:MAG TPA: hypothetical protein VHC43_16185 [Mycobacteriales bacterium]|nr:hypothetical protein [Mycobacteriales bacterium]
MYGWIWRKLPGGIPGKLLGCAVLLFATLVLLFLVVFPWAGPKLPFNHVTVDTTPTAHPTATSSPAVPD